MTEEEFWLILEYRLSHAMPLRGFWCDGFAQQTFRPHIRHPKITGQAWTGESGQDLWTFELKLPKRFQTSDAIDWGTLLFGDNLRGQIELDLNRRLMSIDLSNR